MKWFAVALTVSLLACGSDKTKPSAGSAGSGSAAAPAVSDAVRIFVDDVQVGSLANAQVKLWPRLDTLVPVAARRLGTWEAIQLTSAGAGPVTIAKPSSAYPELVPALFPAEDGKAAFGMFDPVELAKHGQPALRENGVREIHVSISKGGGRGENEHGDGGGSDPTQLKLTIKTTGGDKVIEGAKLLDLPREAPPSEGGGEGKGWRLSAILALAGVTKVNRVRLTDAKGTNLTLERSFGDLDEKVAIPFIKLNRQGTLRFRVYRKQGEAWVPGSDLRGLTTIEILK